jgi:recombination protein RecA
MALRFYASVRLDVRRIESIKQADQVIGNRTRVTVKKNKVAPPFKQAEFDIMYNEGISTSGDILDLAVEHEIVAKRGSFYAYGEMRLGQGRENAKGFLEQNPAVAGEIEAAIRNQFGLSINLAPKSLALSEPALPEAELNEFQDGLFAEVA